MTTLTLNKKTAAYNAARSWADGFTPALNQISCNLIFGNAKLMSVYFKTPTDYQDRKLGTDQIIEMDKLRMSYRIRENKYMPYFLQGFTIRCSAKYGESELEKIMNNPAHADFLLYAIADEKEYGVVECAVLIDLKVLGAYLKAYPEAIEKAHKGQGFIEFKYDDLPKAVVAGTWNLTRKGEVSCQ